MIIKCSHNSYDGKSSNIAYQQRNKLQYSPNYTSTLTTYNSSLALYFAE